MRLFIDANVLIAVLNKEYPLFTYAAKVLSLADKKEFELFTSPVCIAIAFYFACKRTSQAKAKKKIAILLTHIQTTRVDHGCTMLAIENERVLDLEDGIQYYSAIKEGCDHIITENGKDFYYSEIPVSRCEDFLKHNLGFY